MPTVNMNTSTVYTFTDSSYKNTSNANMTGMQGACSDGTYVYVLKCDNAADAVRQTRVVKIDPKTWTVKAVSEPLLLGHANDMTYNPKTGLLYVSPMGTTYYTINPSTLKISETKTFSKDFFGIAYDEVKDRYAFAKSAQSKYNFALMTADGTPTFASEFETVRLGYTAQGIFCDANYIYYTQSGSGSCIVTVHDWDGNRICILYINDGSEIENLFWYDGAFYACFQGSTDYIKKLVVAS